MLEIGNLLEKNITSYGANYAQWKHSTPTANSKDLASLFTSNLLTQDQVVALYAVLAPKTVSITSPTRKELEAFHSLDSHSDFSHTIKLLSGSLPLTSTAKVDILPILDSDGAIEESRRLFIFKCYKILLQKLPKEAMLLTFAHEWAHVKQRVSDSPWVKPGLDLERLLPQDTLDWKPHYARAYARSPIEVDARDYARAVGLSIDPTRYAPLIQQKSQLDLL